MKRRCARTLRALLATAIAAVMLGGPAYAADDDPTSGTTTNAPGVTVGIRTANATAGDDRGFYDYEMPPRAVMTDYVAVSNLRFHPVTVRVLSKDATTTTDSSYSVQESGVTPSDVGGWIAFNLKRQNLVTIPPRSERIIQFQLGVPADATPGDHYGAVVVSLLTREPKPEGGSIVVDNRVALKLHLRVPGALEPSLQVSDLKPSWGGSMSPLGRGDADISYVVRNTGNVALSADQSVALTRILGLPPVEVAGAPIDEILPGGEVTVTQKITSVLGTGPMKAVVTLTPGSTDEGVQPLLSPVTEQSSFNAYPWLVMGAVVVLIGLLTFYFRYWRPRRRLAKAQQGSPTTKSEDAVKAPTEDVMVRLVSRQVSRLLPVLPVLALVLVGLVPSAAHADKPRSWQAITSTKEGTDAVAFDLITTGGCPAPATNMLGMAYGHGFPQEGAVVIGNTEAGVSREGPFLAPLADTMDGLMKMEPRSTPFQGTYKFVIRCILPGGLKTYGEYVVAIKFDSAHHWHQLPPLTTEKGPGSGTGSEPGETDEPDNPDTSQPGDEPGTAEPPPATSDEQEPGTAEEDAGNDAAQINGAADTTEQQGSSNPFSWPLAAAAAAVFLVTLLLFRPVRRRAKSDD